MLLRAAARRAAPLHHRGFAPASSALHSQLKRLVEVLEAHCAAQQPEQRSTSPAHRRRLRWAERRASRLAAKTRLRKAAEAAAAVTEEERAERWLRRGDEHASRRWSSDPERDARVAHGFEHGLRVAFDLSYAAPARTSNPPALACDLHHRVSP